MNFNRVGLRVAAWMILAVTVATALPERDHDRPVAQVPSVAPRVVPSHVWVDAATIATARAAGHLLASGQVTASRRPHVLGVAASLLRTAQVSLATPGPHVPQERVEAARSALVTAAVAVERAAQCASAACESARSVQDVAASTRQAGVAMANLRPYGTLSPEQVSAVATRARAEVVRPVVAPRLVR